MIIKNVKHVELDVVTAIVFLNTKIIKNELREYKCLCFNKNHQHKVDENSKERFFNTCKFSNHNNNKFLSLL